MGTIKQTHLTLVTHNGVSIASAVVAKHTFSYQQSTDRQTDRQTDRPTDKQMNQATRPVAKISIATYDS